MLCQSCGERQATTLIKEISEGQLTQLHLCDACARKLGVGAFFGPGMDLGALLGGMMGAPADLPAEKRCECCGATFREIARAGKVGCAQCYFTFRKELTPTILKLHGTAQHRGKKPTGSALKLVPQVSPLVAVEVPELEEKKRQLQQAVEAQDYERAAVLRDEIKEMERHG